MTKEKDARENGWSRNDDDTFSNPNRPGKLISYEGESGQLYVKKLGENDVYSPYDPNKY